MICTNWTLHHGNPLIPQWPTHITVTRPYLRHPSIPQWPAHNAVNHPRHNDPPHQSDPPIAQLNHTTIIHPYYKDSDHVTNPHQNDPPRWQLPVHTKATDPYHGDLSDQAGPWWSTQSTATWIISNYDPYTLSSPIHITTINPYHNDPDNTTINCVHTIISHQRIIIHRIL